MTKTPRSDAALNGPHGQNWSGIPEVMRQLETELLAAKAELAEARKELAVWTSWTDEEESQPEYAEISAAHPLRTGDYETYAKAQQLVSKRRSKYSLIDLVNWLLKKEADALKGKQQPPEAGK